MYNIAVTAAVLIAAFCIMYAISEGRTLKEEYDEWSTQKRREKYRRMGENRLLMEIKKTIEKQILECVQHKKTQ